MGGFFKERLGGIVRGETERDRVQYAVIFQVNSKGVNVYFLWI